MLSIIWMILKIIGILILVLLGLLIGSVLLVVLVPIRYRVKGSYYGELNGTAKVCWLLHICSVSVIYDGQPDVTLRIFGVPLGKRKKKTEDAMETEFPIAEPELLSVQELKPEEKPAAEEETKLPHKEIGRVRPISVEQKEQCRQDRPGIFKSWKHFIEKLRFSFKHFCDKLKHIRKSVENFDDWIKDEKNRKVIRLLWKQGKKLLRHILPRKARGKILFGFDDPYTTGQVLSYISLVYPLCHRQLSVCPVFDRAVLEGELYVKGRLCIGSIIRSALVLFMNKQFRVLFKKYLRSED